MPTNAKRQAIANLHPPRFEDRGHLIIAGLAGRYSASTLDDLAALWDNEVALLTGCAPACLTGRAASIT